MFWMPKPEEPKKSSVGSTLLKIIIVLGSLAAIGTAVYLFIKKYKENMCTCCDCCDDDYDDLFCDEDDECCCCDCEECEGCEEEAEEAAEEVVIETADEDADKAE